MSDIAIFLFRQDLRILDNLALYNACSKHSKVIAIYVMDPKNRVGAASKWWLHHSLKHLKSKIPLSLFKGDTSEIITTLMSKYQASDLYMSKSYDPTGLAFEKEIISKTQKVHIMPGSYLIEPENFMNKSGFPYTVFTPFWRAYISSNPHIITMPVANVSKIVDAKGLDLSDLDLLPQIHWDSGFYNIWHPGEEGALKSLDYFISSKLKGYGVGRDYPNQNHTSLLSPHLHFGEISPAVVFEEITKSGVSSDAPKFLSELGWREFSNYLLYHNPQILTQNFKQSFDEFPWEWNEKYFYSWCKGVTGYPIVDAGMRELWATGYMHNRVRMIVASFLTKHLLIDWRKGAEWFYDTLVDGDLANNTASWQWVAGCGADAAPYHRIFNPVLQSRKFDQNGDYIRKWLPDISHLPDEYIHAPWEMPLLMRATYPISQYPGPIVDHGFARERAMRAINSLRK